jgi:hypothetical protein
VVRVRRGAERVVRIGAIDSPLLALTSSEEPRASGLGSERTPLQGSERAV